jgi:molecular chaperone GrpE
VRLKTNLFMKRKQTTEKTDMNDKNIPKNQQEQINKDANGAETITETPVEIAENEKKTEDLSAKVLELNDKYLRLYSEFDNYRKRTIKERIEFSKTASEEMIVSMLPVLDDFDRAFKALPENADKDHFIEGMELIYSKFKNILVQKGVEEIKTTGEVFDTDFHEAITNIPVENVEMKGKIVDEVQKGYLLNGKVIRFSKVVVGA